MDRKKTEGWAKPIGHDRTSTRRGLTISRCLPFSVSLITYLPCFTCSLLTDGFSNLTFFLQKKYPSSSEIEDPKNQTVDAGFNATFDCAAKGHPMPSITWIKNDDALAVQSYNRIRVAEIFVDDEQIHSQLVIKGVKREDNGKYYCLANNSAGEKASNPAFLSTKDLGETYAQCFLPWH